MAKKEISEQKKLFCRQYLIDFLGWKAAKRAKYKGKKTSLEATASRLLRQPGVMAYLNKLTKQQQKRLNIGSDRVITEIARIALSDIGEVVGEDNDLLDIKDIPESARRAIASIEINPEFQGRGEDRELVGYTKKLKFWDKNKALEALCKHFGLFEKDNEQQNKGILKELLEAIDGSSKGLPKKSELPE